MDQIKKKNKAAPIKPFQIKNHMWVFVNAMIENPAFDSQTKDTLTLKASAFGSKCELSEDFIKKGKLWWPIERQRSDSYAGSASQSENLASSRMYSIGPSSSQTR
jgi:hypothetical protein